MSDDSSSKAEPQPWTDETKKKFNNKMITEYYDPCQEAANKSIKCLHRNRGDKSMCADYFQAYRDCKKAWIEKRREERKAAGGWW